MRAPGPNADTDTTRYDSYKVSEYVEQWQRLLNRKQPAARVQASEVDRIQQGHRDLHLAVEDATEISA